MTIRFGSCQFSKWILTRGPIAQPRLPVFPRSRERIDNPSLRSSYESTASPEKVVAFYRAKLNVLAPGPGAVVETNTSGKTTFIVKRDPDRLSFVAIEASEGAAGSEIHLTATGAKDSPGR